MGGAGEARLLYFWRSTPVKNADGWTTKLDATNYNTGCARPTTVAQQPLGLWRCRQVKSWTKYLYLAYKSAFQRVRAILKAPGTVKVKLWCFKGIVNPTDIHGSWGTWLLPPLPAHVTPAPVAPSRPFIAGCGDKIARKAFVDCRLFKPFFHLPAYIWFIKAAAAKHLGIFN